MTTQTIDTNTVKQSVDLRELAARYTELHKEAANELAGPCPKCGGNDRFHCTDEWFMCRQCHPKRGDAIAFVMWKDNLGFKEAVATITNTPATPAKPTRRAPATKKQEAQPEDWQRKAAQKVDQAHRRLLDDTDQAAAAGRAYLDSRGIEPHTWIAFKLGFTPGASLPGTEGKQTAPAIVIPWYRAGKVCAIRYRFLKLEEYTDASGKEHRKIKLTSERGSDRAGKLFGGQVLGGCIPELSTLVICEGELNACSIWQVAHDTHLNVLSLGGQDTHITPAMVEYAGKYAQVIVWLDEGEKAQKVMGALPGAHGIKSPGGNDANDLLRSGKLGGLLALHRFQAAPDRQTQEAALWDVWDAAQVWPGPDDYTQSIMAHIAEKLGVTV